MIRTKNLTRRGLEDGTERLRTQLRDIAQRGEQGQYGGNQIEDAAAGGARKIVRGGEQLIKQWKSKRVQGQEPAPPGITTQDTPPARDSSPVLIKTKEAVREPAAVQHTGAESPDMPVISQRGQTAPDPNIKSLLMISFFQIIFLHV